MSHTSQERSFFQIKALNVSMPAMTPSATVSKPEKRIQSLDTNRKRAVNEVPTPTAHHPSIVDGVPKNLVEVVRIVPSHIMIARRIW
jgi:hypothetical protein